MSKHNIHGVTLSIGVRAYHLTDIAKGRCVGKVVNTLRAMPACDFEAALSEKRAARFGGAKWAAMLIMLDNSLAAGYTKRTVDDDGPTVELELAEG